MGSHDFIEFPPDLAYLSARTWLLLGEIQATAQIVRASPVLPAHAYELDLQYLAKGVHGTTAIEGNTFSEEEVEKIIRGDMPVHPSQTAELRQIKNMVEVLNKVARDELFGETPTFSLELFNQYHRQVLQDSPQGIDQQVCVGELRQHGVEVGRYVAPPPQDCEGLIRQLCAWLNEERETSRELDGYDIAWCVVKALVAHVYFAWIQPYGDGNGRMARLIEHAILLRAGLPEVCTHLLSYFYCKTRRQYFVELQLSHGELREGAYPEDGDLRRFIEYALEGFMDELTEQILVIGSMQVQAIWRDHIHGCFPTKMTPAQQRQQRLALDLTDRRVDQPANIREIRKVSSAIHLTYVDQSDAILERDLQALLKKGLLIQDPRGYQPNPEIMMSLFGNSAVNTNK